MLGIKIVYYSKLSFSHCLRIIIKIDNRIYSGVTFFLIWFFICFIFILFFSYFLVEERWVVFLVFYFTSSYSTVSSLIYLICYFICKMKFKLLFVAQNITHSQFLYVVLKVITSRDSGFVLDLISWYVFFSKSCLNSYIE